MTCPRLAVAVAVGLTGCIDFEAARQSYCQVRNRPALCVDPVDGGLGDGNALKAEPAMPGALAWGRRCGGPGDELPRALAVQSNGDLWVAGAFSGTADLCHGTLEAAGGTDLFVARFSSDGEPRELVTAQGLGDEEANGVAVAADAVFVAGAFGAPVSLLGQGPFDAGTSAREGFVARLSGGQLTRWVQLASGGGVSRLTRVAVFKPAASAADQRVVASGTFRGDLAVGVTPIATRVRDTAFLLVFDGDLTLLTWTVATAQCTSSVVDDFALDSTAFAHVFARLQGGTPGCAFGSLPGGLVLPATTPVTFTLWLQGSGEQDGNGFAYLTSESAPVFPLTGTYADGEVFLVTQGESRGNVRLHFPSGSHVLSATDARGHAMTSRQGLVLGAYAYRGDPANFLGQPLPARDELSPCFFATEPGSPVWVRGLSAGGGAATTRGVVTSADGALIATGDFSGFFGTDVERLQSSGGADLFLLRFHP